MTDPTFPKTGSIDPDGDLNSDENVEQLRMPLLEHLRELRRRLIISLVAIGLGMVVCFSFAEPIWEFLVAPMAAALEESGKGTMAIHEPLEGFITYIKIAALAGAALAIPVLFYQAWQFVAPGLYPNEQRFIMPMVVASTCLFAAGASFGYFVIFRFAFPFFLEIIADDVEAVLSINSYLGVATKLLFAFGFCFQLPVVVFALARVGLIHHRDMINVFKFAVVASFVVSAIITPPDVLSQALMAGPLILLYGVGIMIAWIFSTKELESAE